MHKEIRKLKPNKSVKDTDIPVNIFKNNMQNFFAEYTYLQYKEAIRSSNFPNYFNFENIAAVFKQSLRNLSKILKDLHAANPRITFTISFRNFSVVLGKVTVHNIVSL